MAKSNAAGLAGLGAILAALLYAITGIQKGPSNASNGGDGGGGSPLVSDMLSWAVSKRGMSYANDGAEYTRVVYPGDLDKDGKPTAGAMADASKESSCLLFARAYLIHGGMLPLEPYKPGNAGPQMVTEAAKHGALVDAAKADTLQPGDIALMGGSPELGGMQHGAIVTAKDGDTVYTIDGGQTGPDGKPTAIDDNTRPLARKGNAWTLGGILGPRVITHIIRPSLWRLR